MSKETDRANRLCNLQYTNNAGKPSLGPIREGGDIVCCICCKQKDVAYKEHIYIYIYMELTFQEDSDQGRAHAKSSIPQKSA